MIGHGVLCPKTYSYYNSFSKKIQKTVGVFYWKYRWEISFKLKLVGLAYSVFPTQHHEKQINDNNEERRALTVSLLVTWEYMGLWSHLFLTLLTQIGKYLKIQLLKI